MSLKIGQFIADPKPQEEGVWITFDEEQGVKFKIAYIGNRLYEAKFTKLSLAARRRTRGRDIPPHVLSQVTNEAIAGTILLDWTGLTDDAPAPKEGETGPATVPFEYSEANAIRLLKESRIFREFIMEEAMNLDNFQAAPIDVAGEKKEESAAAADIKSRPALEPRTS